MEVEACGEGGEGGGGEGSGWDHAGCSRVCVEVAVAEWVESACGGRGGAGQEDGRWLAGRAGQGVGGQPCEGRAAAESPVCREQVAEYSRAQPLPARRERERERERKFEREELMLRG